MHVFLEHSSVERTDRKGSRQKQVNYTSFYISETNKPILVSRQLGEYEKLLPDTEFTRIHDKYIINLSYIREYIKGSGGDVVLENGKELPVASRRKEDFLSRFEKWIKRKT